MKLAPLILISSIAIACGARQTPPGSMPINPPDSDQCAPMCDHFLKLGCDEAKPLYNSDLPGPKDVPNQTCVAWCVELQSKGTYLNPRCLKVVPFCENIEEWRKKTCTQ